MQKLAEHLQLYRDWLIRMLGQRAGWLLRHESAEDLAQGVHLRALEGAEYFEWRGEAEFKGWLAEVGKQHLAARANYWRAVKRDAGFMLRLASEQNDSRVSAVAIDPSASMTGPVTFAVRREMLRVAMKALGTLQPRDRELVSLRVAGAGIDEIGERLDLSYKAAQRALHRALQRFGQSFHMLALSRRGTS